MSTEESIHNTDEHGASGDLTEADIQELREIHERRHVETLEPSLGNDFQELAEYLARRAGISVPSGFVFRCAGGCDKTVARRGVYCGECAAEDRLRQRQMMLAEAYASVSRVGSDGGDGDALKWCRAGTPEYIAATQRARSAAATLAERNVAMALIERGGWGRELGNVVILGPKRIGKSKTAVACAHRFLDKALRGELDAGAFRFARGIRVISGLKLGRARLTTRLGEVPELERVAQRATLLIIDEVGFEEDSTVIRDVIYERCEDRRRPTFLTSGLTLAALQDRYGAPTIERLREHGHIIDLHVSANTKAA